MAIIYTDFVSGTLTAGITSSASSFASAGLTLLSTIGGSDIAKIVLDPFGQFGAPEIVYVSTHTAASSTVSGVQRGQEGTVARAHSSGVLLMNVPTAGDFRDLRTSVDNVLNSPGSTLATAAPVDLVAGGGAQIGSGIAVSKSDHRHALPAGTPAASSPSDTVSDGVASSVARSDHKHAREAYAASVQGVGTATSPGVASTVARGDHVHILGAGALNVNTQVGSGLELTTICTSGTRPAHAKGRFIVETDTSRRYESNGTAWLRRETLAGDSAQTGVSLVATPSIPNNTLTRVSSFTVNASHDTDSFRVDGQYGKIPTGLAGAYLITWQAVMNDGSIPSWLECTFTLTNALGTGINAKYSAQNGTKASQALNTRYLNLASNQYFVVDVLQTAGISKQVNITVDMILLNNTGP